jgi:hypothetical protein
MDRESLKKWIVARYSTRLHMSLILGATCLVAMISSAAMLHAGLHDMRLRYPCVVTLAYLTFLCGVWVWLRLTGLERPSKDSSKASSLDDVLDVVTSGRGGSGRSGGGGGLGRIGSGIGKGGGTFDGGGASASFADGGSRASLLAVNPAGSNSNATLPIDGKGLTRGLGGLPDLGGDDLGAVVLLLVLGLAIFLASGFLVWMGPDILTEAAFGAALAGSLAKRSRDQSDAGWVAGVVKKTWWPFASVLVLALVFASYAHSHHPGAKTFREAIHGAVNG